MSLYRRQKNGHWWIDINVNGRRIRESTKTRNKEDAQRYHDTLKAECWRQSKLKEKPDYIWQDAVKEWIKDKSYKRSIEKDKEIFRWLRPFLDGKKLRDITREDLKLLAETKANGASRATANRTMSLVRAVLNRARDEWEWIDSVAKVPMYPKGEGRVRWITEAEAEKVLKNLPEHSADMAKLALATGLRRSNITHLKWEQVDLYKRVLWINPDQSKNKEAIGVPLNRDAIAVIQKQLGKNDEYVFTYRGKPVQQVCTKAWRDAVKKAGQEGLTFHDLRHSWASWHSQNGTPRHILQELGSWKSEEMVKRYAHLSTHHMAEYAENSARSGTNSSHLRLVADKDER